MTLKQFKTHYPCWLNNPGTEAHLNEIGSRKEDWTVDDVLALYRVDVMHFDDIIWAVCVVAGPERSRAACNYLKGVVSEKVGPYPLGYTPTEMYPFHHIWSVISGLIGILSTYGDSNRHFEYLKEAFKE